MGKLSSRGSVATAIVFTIAVATVFAAGLWSPASAAAARRFSAAPPPGSAYVPGQLLVEFGAGATARDVSVTTRALGATVVRTLAEPANGDGTRVVVVSSDTLDTHALAAAFAGVAAVTRTSPNYYRHVMALPNDPGLVSQWGLQHIGMPQVWEAPLVLAPVVVASVDTGVDFLHPDLAANMWHNPAEIPGNGVDDDGNGYIDDVFGIDAVNHDSSPMDDYGHGTHTSGIVAAVADNGIGVAGVSPNAQIMAVKFLSADGWGTDAGAIETIDYVTRQKVDQGVNVVAINASWGGGRPNAMLRAAIRRAGNAGIVFCAAAGNEGGNNDVRPSYPASYPCDNIVAVAASNRFDDITGWSCWGPRSVDLAAPGADILSTINRIPLGEGWDAMYASHDGTSMATPFVAGAVAVCAGAFPAESMEQRIERITSSVDRLPQLAGRCATGGRLDLAAALGLGDVQGDATPPHTTVLGSDAAWHDVPQSLSLWSSDGVGGSGVASTRWRIDGGKWKAGSDVFVKAKRATKVTHVIQYQSVDRAGNREPAKSVEVNIDTTNRADNDPPGVPLTVSPVSGDVQYWFDHNDIYSLHLDAGESVKAVATGLPGALPMVMLYPAGVAGVEGVTPLAYSEEDEIGATLTYCVEETGTYYVAVAGAWLAAHYELAWSVLPAGFDVTPPIASAKGGFTPDWWDEFPWSNHPIRVRLAAEDGLNGSGVALIESSLDEGETWSAGSYPVVPAPSDHSNDGLHTVYYRATDVAGNVSMPSSTLVAIDTRGPMTETWAPLRPVRRGSYCWVRTRIDEQTWGVRGEVIIKSVATGDVVATKSDRWFGSGRDWTVFKCDLPRGNYDVLIAGKTYDQAGNLWTSAVSHQMLRVR